MGLVGISGASWAILQHVFRWISTPQALEAQTTGQVMTQKRQMHQHVEQVVEVPVPMTQEEVVHVPKIMTQTRVMQQHVEQVVEVPIPMTQEEVIHVPEIITQTRIVHQPVEQIVEARPDKKSNFCFSHDSIVWTFLRA